MDQFDRAVVHLTEEIRAQASVLIIKFLKHQDRAVAVDGDAAMQLGL